MEEKPIVSVSFLTTGEDYRRFRCESARLSATAQGRAFFRALGIVLLVIGVLGAVFLSQNALNYLIWGFCLISGLFFSFYYSLVEPFLVARRANQEYAKIHDKLRAQTVELFPDCLHTHNTCLDGHYPYELIFRAVHTDAFFLLFLGQGELRMLPTRLLEKDQIAAAAAFLQQKLGSRYEEAAAQAPQSGVPPQ